MPDLENFRAGKPGFYPDQAIYAQYACAKLALTFEEIDGGSGLVFTVASGNAHATFAAGRCSWYPQNNATASSLASDKYFTNLILEHAGVPTLGGQYFFLHDRHRAHRSAGHERSDAVSYFRTLGNSAFLKPLLGSRGDFAQAIESEAAFLKYLENVSRHYDSVLIQPIVTGVEFRIFVLDDAVLYTARKQPPVLTGDGLSPLRELLANFNAGLQSRGLSDAAIDGDHTELNRVLPAGEQWNIPGRLNLSAGGRMVLEPFDDTHPAGRLARNAVRALGLRVAAVDLFTDIDGVAGQIKIIEVNANPSIRVLEESDRSDLILEIWRHTFSALGLMRV